MKEGALHLAHDEPVRPTEIAVLLATGVSIWSSSLHNLAELCGRINPPPPHR